MNMFKFVGLCSLIQESKEDHYCCSHGMCWYHSDHSDDRCVLLLPEGQSKEVGSETDRTYEPHGRDGGQCQQIDHLVLRV